MERLKLSAALRTGLGKQKVKRLRTDGQLPAIMYGKGIEPTPLQVGAEAFLQVVKTSARNALVDLDIEGAAEPSTCMIKKIAKNPVSGIILNIDFYRVLVTDRVLSRVPLEFLGDPIGVAEGGSLIKPVNDLEIRGPAGDLPSILQADISNLSVGDSFHVSDLILPEGIEVMAPAEEVLAIVHAPHGAAEETAAAEEETAEAE